MRNLLIILLGAFVLAGCGQTLKNSWGNFKAYYNTYYNAKEGFNAGLNKVQEQPFTIDPSEPVRIHHAPVQAGGSDFQEAIEKGAKVLRNHSDTKWVDDAILLIGKSYYYRLEFHSALQKFEELRDATSSPEMKQLSIIWKGRALLDLNLHAEGISFLESELQEYPEEWSAESKAEIQALAAEHHVMLENWEEAANFLTEALNNIEDELLGRTYFLQGQVFERLQQYGDSYFAFSQVPNSFPGFEYNYWARFKQADIARKQESYDLALSIYEELMLDDKNVDRISQLQFEIAHTLEMKGEIAEAEKRYKDLLYDRKGQNNRNLRADIYYRLGQIYSEEYDQVAVAAAYFDSSSTSSQSLTRVEASRDPGEMADTFGEYERLQNTIARSDSLLQLGSLSKTELDSALEEIRAEKRKELIDQQQSESASRQVLANRNVSDFEDQNSTSSSQYGFLNHQSNDRINQSKAEFRAIWGNRPLVDNWRSVRRVRANTSSDQSVTTSQETPEPDEELQSLGINLEDIPRTPAAREKLKDEKLNAQYRLGNLLFLNLESPDEARKYFHKVINSQAAGDLRPRAMYSLYELFNSDDFANQDSARYWKNKILEEYPGSQYASNISDDKRSASSESDSSQKLARQLQQIESSGEKKPHKLRKLALENRDSQLAPYIHYQAIQHYIEQAKDFDEVADSLEPSIYAFKADTASQSVSQYSFRGTYWDSVRTVIQEFDTTFTNASADQRQRVAALRKALQQREESAQQIPSCEDLNTSLSIEPSMEEFLSGVTYPEKVKDMSISGQVIYSFVVTPAGEIESYELVSQPTSLGIESSFERAFEQSLNFEPLELELDDSPSAIECEVSFPIKQ